MGGDALMQCNHLPNFYFEKLLNACLSFGGSQGRTDFVERDMSGEEAVRQGHGPHGFRAFCQLPTDYNLRTLHLGAFARSHAVEDALTVAFAAAQGLIHSR